MADVSNQMGYIICGGRLLDLNSALDVTEDFNNTSQMLKDRTNASNAIKHLQTTAENSQDNDASKCFSTGIERQTSQPQGNNDGTRRRISSTTDSKADALKSMKGCVVPDATNKSYNSITSNSTASVTSSTGERNATTASVNLPLMTKPTTYNNDPAFSSDVVVLGKRIVAIRKLACEEFHHVDDGDASTAAAIGRVSFTDRASLSDNMVSNVNNSDTIPVPTINSFSLLAQKDSKPNDSRDEEKNNTSNIFSFSNTLPLSELRLSESLNSITNSSNLNNSSPSGFLVKLFDVSGCYVIPGFIDSHMHAYQYSTPLGIKVDECCLKRGVTTAIDAGSAGAATFAGLRKFIAEKSITRVLAFVHIASHGLAAAGCSGFGRGGECDSLNQVDVDKCVSCVKENRDMVVGVKVRLAADIADNGRNEEEVYRRALVAARQAEVPLMVHHAVSTIPITKTGDQLSCPGDLAAGDIYTHTFHGYPSTILDPESWTIPKTVWEAKKRGVLFDVGHGQGSFNWTVLEKCAAEGFWPDTISTDLHSGNLQGPAYDLPTVMTKLLHVGMPFVEIIKAVTITPARALGISDKVGVLAPGREADITIVKIENCDVWLEDSAGQRRRIRKRIVPVAVFKGGELFETYRPVSWPNVETGKKLATQWKSQVVRDSDEPKF